MNFGMFLEKIRNDLNKNNEKNETKLSPKLKGITDKSRCNRLTDNKEKLNRVTSMDNFMKYSWSWTI